MFPISSLKTPLFVVRDFWSLSRVYTRILPLNLRTLGCVQKAKCFWSFPWSGIWVTYLIAFHMPWDHSYFTFHYPIEALYKEPFGTLKEEELKSKKIIVHCCRSLYLILHPFVPWSTFCSSQVFLLLVSLLLRDGGLRWWWPVTERNSYGLGYHNRQLDSRNQSFPICNRN